MAASGGVLYATPSKRAFSSINFEDGLEDRENFSPMRVNQGHAATAWFPPHKRVRNDGSSNQGSICRSATMAENSAFPSVGCPANFASDKVKEFIKQQKKATRAAAAGGVLAAAAAQFRASPGPVRVGAAARGGETGFGAVRADAMQQNSPQRDCSIPVGEDSSDDDDDESTGMMDGARGGSADCKFKDSKKQRLFSWVDVERILHAALQEQETELRRQYDDLLRAQLHEQFANFTRFNQDHISRSLQNSTHDYFG